MAAGLFTVPTFVLLFWPYYKKGGCAVTDRREGPHSTLAQSEDDWFTWVRRGFFIALGF